jgi:hypothetical protein
LFQWRGKWVWGDWGIFDIGLYVLGLREKRVQSSGRCKKLMWGRFRVVFLDLFLSGVINNAASLSFIPQASNIKEFMSSNLIGIYGPSCSIVAIKS